MRRWFIVEDYGLTPNKEDYFIEITIYQEDKGQLASICFNYPSLVESILKEFKISNKAIKENKELQEAFKEYKELYSLKA